MSIGSKWEIGVRYIHLYTNTLLNPSHLPQLWVQYQDRLDSTALIGNQSNAEINGNLPRKNVLSIQSWIDMIVQARIKYSWLFVSVKPEIQVCPVVNPYAQKRGKGILFQGVILCKLERNGLSQNLNSTLKSHCSAPITTTLRVTLILRGIHWLSISFVWLNLLLVFADTYRSLSTSASC